MKKSTRKISKEEREAFAIVGSFGGRTTFRNKGKAHMQSIGRKGAQKRWGKKTKKD